jgi:hypothetical protein
LADSPGVHCGGRLPGQKADRQGARPLEPDDRLRLGDPVHYWHPRHDRMGHVSDRMGERRWNCFFACLCATAGLIIAGVTLSTWRSLLGLSLATIGFYGMKPWPMPSLFLTGTAAGRRYCVDQCPRQPRRHGHPVHRGQDQRYDRELLGRSRCARRLRTARRDRHP